MSEMNNSEINIMNTIPTIVIITVSMFLPIFGRFEGKKNFSRQGAEVIDNVVGATNKDTLKSKIDAML